MPLVIPTGFMQLVYSWNLTGDPEPMVCTMGYDVSAGTGDMNAFLDARRTAYTTAWGAAGRLNVYALAKLTAYVGMGGTSPVVYEKTYAEVGTMVGHPPPSNCAVLVRKNTALGGRRGRGRMYLPPFMLAEGSVDPNGNLDSAFVTGNTQNCTTAFVTNMNPVLFHNSDGVTPAPAPTPITSVAVQSKIATQRRRMRR